MGRILGIDYGDRRVGIAVSDETHSCAFVRRTLQNRGFTGLVADLRAIVQDENIERIVAGLPRSMDGSEGVQAEKVKKAVEKIAEALQVPAIFEDERLTTSYADRFVDSSADRDSIAAAAILESYLERTGGANK